MEIKILIIFYIPNNQKYIQSRKRWPFNRIKIVREIYILQRCTFTAETVCVKDSLDSKTPTGTRVQFEILH